MLFNVCYVESGSEVKEGWSSTDASHRDERGPLFQTLPLRGSVADYRHLKKQDRCVCVCMCKC